MSLQQSVNAALGAAGQASMTAKFMSQNQEMIKTQQAALEAQKNQLLEMRKLANKHLKDTREARQEQRKEFSYNLSGRVLKDPRDPKVREATAEAGMKYSKAIQEHEEAKADRREIIKKQKELEDK